MSRARSAAVALVAVALVTLGPAGCGSTTPSGTPTTTRPPPSTAPTTVAPTSTVPGTTPSATTTVPTPAGVTTTAPSPAAVTITNATFGAAAQRGVALRVGAVLDIELTSGAYTRSGVLVPWPVTLQPAPPGVSPVLVVVAAAPSTCPSATSCHRFTGVAPGHAEIVISGPSGIVCDKDGAHCIGVSAVVAHVTVTVTA